MTSYGTTSSAPYNFSSGSYPYYPSYQIPGISAYQPSTSYPGQLQGFSNTTNILPTQPSKVKKHHN